MNPYHPDTLLNNALSHADRFIGLRDELEWVLSRISERRPSAVSLVGPMGVGKSFLLTYLAAVRGARNSFPYAIGERFRDDLARLQFVTIECSDPDTIEGARKSLASLLFNQLLESLAQLLELGGADDVRLIDLDRLPSGRMRSVAELRAQAQRRIELAREEADDTELRQRFDEQLGGGSPADALPALLARLDGWGLRVIFLLDDFDSITDVLSRADFDFLRTLLSSASLVIVTHKALSKLVPAEVQTSPFFNLVQRLDLRSLYSWSQEDATRMIVEPPSWLPHTPAIRFSQSDVDFILGLTGTHPDLLRTVCEELFIRYRRRVPPAGGDVIPEDDRRLLRVQLGALFTDSFAALWHRLNDDERAMLQEIAANKVTVDDSLTPALSSVINQGYVVIKEGRYRLFAGLFYDYISQITGVFPIPASQPVRAQLTDLEQKLLKILEARQGSTVDKGEIISTLYGTPDSEEAERQYQSRLEALIFRLRGKLDSEQHQIENIRGQGYRLVASKQ